MENIAHIQAMTVLAVGIIFGMGALGTAIGFASWAGASSRARRGSRSCCRCCGCRCSWVAGLLDAVAMIGIGFALFFTFANPFVARCRRRTDRSTR